MSSRQGRHRSKALNYTGKALNYTGKAVVKAGTVKIPKKTQHTCLHSCCVARMPRNMPSAAMAMALPLFSKMASFVAVVCAWFWASSLSAIVLSSL